MKKKKRRSQEISLPTIPSNARFPEPLLLQDTDPWFPSGPVFQKAHPLMRRALAVYFGRAVSLQNEESFAHDLRDKGFHGETSLLRAWAEEITRVAEQLVGAGRENDIAELIDIAKRLLEFDRELSRERTKIRRTIDPPSDPTQLQKQIRNRVGTQTEEQGGDSSEEQPPPAPATAASPGPCMATPSPVPRVDSPSVKSLEERKAQEQKSRDDSKPQQNLHLIKATDELISRRPPQRGAPKRPEAEKTRNHWIKLGRPQLDKNVKDSLAQHTYPEEYAKAARYSAGRKKLRDRVAGQVKPLLVKAAPAI